MADRLVSLLGQGGYAGVYLGQHLRLNQQAAIKVLHAYLTETDAGRFQQEAQTISTLIHPSIIRVFDYDVQDSVPFLVMDYAPHGSLRRHYPRGNPVPLSQIVSYVRQMAAALQYAHEQKCIHRDVKPENMLLGRQEEVLLSDFGLAALAHSSGSLSTQEAVGTLAYMAPEQIEGYPRAASDQYALGVVVYEWLCGSRPFEGSPTEVMVQQLSMPPPPLHEKVATMPLEVEQVVLRALAKDPKARFVSMQAFAEAFEQASQLAPSPGILLTDEPPLPGPDVAVALTPIQAGAPTEVTPSADLAAGAFEPTVFPDSPLPAEIDNPQSGNIPETPRSGQLVAPMAGALPSLLEPMMLVHKSARRLSGRTAGLLIGLVVVVIAAGILGSTSLLVRFGVIGARSGPTTPTVVRGGTWTYGLYVDPNWLIPNRTAYTSSEVADLVDQALYLPLFYGDAHGGVHPGAATEIPSLQNGGISADGMTWTFHLRPHLVWSDGQPYDARDVDYSWKLWLNPQFGAFTTQGFDLISRAEVSADHLSITFHLKQAYAPFLTLWVGGFAAPLPMHHFSAMAPEAIKKSPDNLNPRVTSGPFMMEESKPSDLYTLVRNPRYSRAREELPYLNKIVFRIVGDEVKDLQAGIIDSDPFVAVDQVPVYQRLTDYTLVAPPTGTGFEGIFFNFHNTVLASHPEVRQTIAMAIDHQALIKKAIYGYGSELCTDHGSGMHPGYDSLAGCPDFNPAAANKLLDDSGWVKGSDGVRAKGGQRLEFEYSTNVTGYAYRLDVEAMVQSNLQAIGIKLDIQNYPSDTFFDPFLSGGKASPPTGAVAGRYDIAEFAWSFGYDPDDSGLLSCDQIPPKGSNVTFYCNRTLDALYKQELAAVDAGVRQSIFVQIHQIYLTQFPFITLYGTTFVSIVHKRTHNYQPSPFEGDTINIWEWWCDHGKC